MTRPLVLLALLAGACVAKGQHEIVQVQLDATRTALHARQAACQEELTELQAQLATLRAEVGSRQHQLVALEERVQHLNEELEALRAEKADWLRALPAPVEAPEEPAPRRPREPEPTEEEVELQKWVEAEVADITLALARSTDHTIEEDRADRQHQTVAAAFAKVVEDGYAEVESVDGGSVVRIPEAKLFQEGKVYLSPRGEAIVTDVASALSELGDHHLQIAGHTDDRPHHSAQHASSWELGFAEAMAVLRFLEDLGYERQASAASFAGTQPRVPNDGPEGRKQNRRVELWLRADPALEHRFQAPSPGEDAQGAAPEVHPPGERAQLR